MMLRFDLLDSITSPQRGVRRVRKRKSASHFGIKVVGASLVAFLVVFYSDYLPAAGRGIINFSRNIGRDHAPPAGAYYSGCNEARAAGVAPIYAGEPGYREEMDGDADGIACEPYRHS